MDKFKKQTIGARVPNELFEAMKNEMANREINQTTLLEQIIREHYTTPEPEPEKGNVEWTLDVLECNERVVGALLEICDKKKVNKIKAIEMIVSFVEHETGQVKEKYLSLARQLKQNKNV